jgi:Ca2+-binding RTX toxin-like protein
MTDGPSQGMNLGGKPDAYGDSFVAIDLMKGLSQWQYWTGQEAIDLGPATLRTDQRGWVTDMPIINGSPTEIFANVFYGKIAKPQQFIMEWDGAGKIEVDADYTVIGRNKILINFNPDYTDDAGNPQQDGLSIILQSTDPNKTGNHIRNIQLYNADDADLIAAGERFNPDWFDRVDDFRVLRTHDWQSTNFPTSVDWTRNTETADQARWGADGAGMPYELLVQMANETRSDLWINIPHTASRQYMQEAAAYVKANLDPGLKLMVEFSNEYWTTIFDQYDYFQRGGARRFGSDEFAAGQFYGVKAAQMADIFAAEFGRNSDVLRPTLTVDDVMFKTGEAEAMLTAPSFVAQGGTQPVTRDFDVIATDGYLSWYAPDESTGNLIRSWMTDADGGFGRARDFLLNQLNTELLPNWQRGRALADEYGLDFMVYEGGALLLNFPGDNPDPALTDFAIRFTQSTELREVYEATLEAWATVGSGPFAWYADVGRPGPWGDYGHWKGEDFVPDPRTGAITDANEDVQPWWIGDDRPASNWDNGKYDAGTNAANTLGGTALGDRLYGLKGNDVLQGKAGGDRLWGGLGNDTIAGGMGADEINGGAGRDLASYADSTRAVSVSLTTGKGFGGQAAGDVLTGIEQLRGSGFADRLSGNGVSNTIWGGRGDDTITGGYGPDVVSGGAGSDRFVFHKPQGGGDTLVDFAAAGDDVFALSASFFGNHVSGGLLQREFQTSNSTIARNADTRVIYDRDDAQIWFDADGNGTQVATLLATVQQGAIVTAADFVFF